MTIDEAINGLKSIFGNYELDLPCTDSFNILSKTICYLEELKRYRKDHAFAENRAYSKALKDFEFACVKMIREEQDTRYGYLDGMDIREIAEKLRAGGENDD